MVRLGAVRAYGASSQSAQWLLRMRMQLRMRLRLEVDKPRSRLTHVEGL